MRLPLAVDLKINQFSGAAITEYESGMINAIAKNKNGKVVATQRPAVDMFEDASVVTAKVRGRAIYYWEATSNLYILNDDKLCKGSQSNVIATLSAGTKKCKFLVIGTVLVLIDKQNNKGYTITAGDVVTEITDLDFPPKQTPAITLAYGAAVLDRTLYVLGEDGTIYGSDLNNPASWNALNYVTAERDPDGGIFIAKHHDNVVVFGTRSIEFFYDAANATGSPLNRRSDVAYTIGCVSGETALSVGDRVYFIGTNDEGALGVYRLEQFSVKKISTDDIDRFLTHSIIKTGYSCVGSGFSSDGHEFYLLTLYTTPTNISDERTLVYDDTSGIWSPSWNLTIGGHSNFPLMDWTVRSAVLPRYGEGILANGDLISLTSNGIPQDTVAGRSFVTSGYVDVGYMQTTSDSGSPIAVSIRTGQFDGESSNIKQCSNLKYVGNTTAASQTITIKHANENNQSFSSGNMLDISKRGSIRRLGKFIRRNHQVEYSATEMVESEALEIEFGVIGK